MPTWTVRIWRLQPGEKAGMLGTRPYDETRYVDLPEDVDDAREEFRKRGIARPGDTWKLEAKERA